MLLAFGGITVRQCTSKIPNRYISSSPKFISDKTFSRKPAIAPRPKQIVKIPKASFKPTTSPIAPSSQTVVSDKVLSRKSDVAQKQVVKVPKTPAKPMTSATSNRYASLPQKLISDKKFPQKPDAVQKSNRKNSKNIFEAGASATSVPQFSPDLLRWPTDNRAFFEGKKLEEYIQPTQSGRIASGGCTRNQGKKFHAGVDTQSVHRDCRYVPKDIIFSVLPGRAVHVNTNPKNGAYGNYVIPEHFEPNLRFYTLYAHLASVEPTRKSDNY